MMKFTRNHNVEGQGKEKYFKYKDELYKVEDTGKMLQIRINSPKSLKIEILSIAEIVLTDYLKKPRPSQKHFVGYRDFDYRNISELNIFWETARGK